MPADTASPRPDALETPEARIEALCRRQGRKYGWLAAKAGIEVTVFSHRLAGRSAWRPEERDKIAEALGVPVSWIWPPGATATE
jgi:lambda repressor-like predicted transcriptional regulator